MSEVFLCFTCCLPTSSRTPVILIFFFKLDFFLSNLFLQKRRRRKIDLSMIGPPANFQHLNHIGSGESGGNGVQQHMQSKGGYEHKTEVNVERRVVDIKSSI